MRDAQPPGDDARERLLDAAARIGERLVHGAVWTDHGCTWRRMRAHPGAEAPVPELAPGTLYGGAAGIALFLAELHHARGTAGGEATARTARGGLEFALRAAASLPHASFGLYGGRLGIAYAAVRAGPRLGLDLRAEAEAVLRPLAGNEARDTGVDVVSGAAGAIPALLWLSDHLDPGLTVGMARRLADHLRALAHRHPHGWSWGATPAATRALCGFSHGASGMAHAFLELHARTGDGEYRYAAEQALAYERAHLSPRHGNWPDFRHKALAACLAEGRLPELRERLRAGGERPAPPAGYPRFWCHGAPGIGLVRLRAHALLGDPWLLDEARIAIRATVDSLDDPLGYSLCHGLGGNCDTLLLAASVLGDESLRDTARRCALRGIARYEDAGLPWPAGVADGETDPGLLLGEAGIGLFLLRAAHPAVPSVLLVTPPDAGASPGGTGDAGYEAARRSGVGEHFGRTLRRLAALGAPLALPRAPRGDGPGPPLPDVAAAHAALRARIRDEPCATRRALLDDAFRLEDARYALLAAPVDLAEEYMDSLARPAADEVGWDTARLVLSPRTRVVHTRCDGAGEPAHPGEAGEEAAHLLHRSGMNVAEHPLAPFAAAVLDALARPATLGEVTDAVARALSAPAGPARRRWLRERVRDQVAKAYGAGFVDLAP